VKIITVCFEQIMYKNVCRFWDVYNDVYNICKSIVELQKKLF